MEEGKDREWGDIERKEKDRERGKDGGVLKVGETLAQGPAPKPLTSG